MNTREKELFRELWRKASREPQGVTVPCESEGEAKRLRFALYAAVKELRSPSAACDSTLRIAVDEVSVVLQKAPPAIVLERRWNKGLLGRVAEIIGQVPQAGKTEEAALQERGEAVFGKLLSHEEPILQRTKENSTQELEILGIPYPRRPRD